MSVNDSRTVKLLKLLRRRGLRHSMNTIAASFARKYLRVPHNVLANFEIVLAEDRPARLSTPQTGPLRINWILLDVVAAQGGLLNIFRTIKQLEAWGHENRVYLLAGSPQGSSEAKQRIRKRYFPINADVELLSDNVKDCDALIATSWPTAYAVRSIENTAQKFYFVQDIEYMFYPPGSAYEFARQTYQFGFRGITLGSWIANVLRSEFKMEC